MRKILLIKSLNNFSINFFYQERKKILFRQAKTDSVVNMKKNDEILRLLDAALNQLSSLQSY
jgi:hypothetical protein